MTWCWWSVTGHTLVRGAAHDDSYLLSLWHHKCRAIGKHLVFEVCPAPLPLAGSFSAEIEHVESAAGPVRETTLIGSSTNTMKKYYRNIVLYPSDEKLLMYTRWFVSLWGQGTPGYTQHKNNNYSRFGSGFFIICTGYTFWQFIGRQQRNIICYNQVNEALTLLLSLGNLTPFNV